MTKRQVNIHVITLESELRFTMGSDTTGGELFEQVAKNIGIQEKWFFGLQYIDSKNVECWLKPEKKVLAHDFPKSDGNVLTFRFRVRFYPEDVSEELIQDITQRFFYLQVKEAILSGEIHCPSETCVLLASYAMQSKFGDFQQDLYEAGSLLKQRILPKRVVEQYRLSPEQWEASVISWWQEHQGMIREDARMEYLKVAQDLEMYGVTYFPIQNKKKTDLYLGVDALGLNIYDRRDKIVPKIGFPWTEIVGLSCERKKFVIRPADKKAPNIVFFAERRRINRQIVALCQGNHELYKRRRKTLPNEIQTMKDQAERERAARRIQRDRQVAEKKRHEQEQAEFKQRAKVLEDAAKSVQQAVEEQNRLVQQAEEQRERLDEAERRLSEERERNQQLEQRIIEDARRVQEEEKKLLQQIEETDEMAELYAEQVQKKLRDAYQLEQELHETSIRVTEAQQLEIHSNGSRYHEPDDSDPSEYDEPAADIRPKYEDDDSSEQSPRNVELEIPSRVTRPEPDRSAVTVRNGTIGAKLKETRRVLEPERLQVETPEDKIYRENLEKGIDKYKTLKKIREGTVKRRIDEFEAM